MNAFDVAHACIKTRRRAALMGHGSPVPESIVEYSGNTQAIAMACTRHIQATYSPEVDAFSHCTELTEAPGDP